MSQKLRFAGFEAGLGVIVMGLFWLPAVLGFVGLIALLATAQAAVNATSLGGGALLLAGIAAMTWMLRLTLRGFRTIELRDDGAWILRNPIGVRLATLAPDVERAIDVKQRDQWLFVGTAIRTRQAWIEIVTPTRRYRSVRSVPKLQAAAITALRGRARFV